MSFAEKFADRLPAKFPGCWQDPDWKRRYKNAHERARRGYTARPLPKLSRRFASSLPATYPGCWDDPKFRREYRTAWMRVKRGAIQRPGHVHIRRLAFRLPPARPALPVRHIASAPVMRLRKLKCAFCHRRAVKPIVRSHELCDGEFVDLTFPYCGEC